MEQIKQKVHTQECLEDLVKLVNEELDSTRGLLKDKLDTIDAELNDVKARLAKHYDALETGKISLDDLSPRIKELKARQDELMRDRVQVEADMVVEGVQHVKAETVKAYAQDLRSLLDEADFTRSKTFLRSFVERITIEGNKAKIRYRLPMPPQWQDHDEFSVLSIEPPSGAGVIIGRTFSITFT